MQDRNQPITKLLQANLAYQETDSLSEMMLCRKMDSWRLMTVAETIYHGETV